MSLAALPRFKKLVLALSLATAAGLWAGGPAQAAPTDQQALKLLGKPVRPPAGQILSLKPRPAAPGSRQTFDQRDYSNESGVVRKRHGADVFVDMNRQVAEDSESWRGTAGLQINW